MPSPGQRLHDLERRYRVRNASELHRFRRVGGLYVHGRCHLLGYGNGLYEREHRDGHVRPRHARLLLHCEQRAVRDKQDLPERQLRL